MDNAAFEYTNWLQTCLEIILTNTNRMESCYLSIRAFLNCRQKHLSFKLTLRTPSSKLSVGNVRRPSSSDGLRHVSATNLPESPTLQSPRRNGNIVTPITQPSRGNKFIYRFAFWSSYKDSILRKQFKEFCKLTKSLQKVYSVYIKSCKIDFL